MYEDELREHAGRSDHRRSSAMTEQQPTLPAPILGMAGWGVPNPAGGYFLSDGYETAEQATLAAEMRQPGTRVRLVHDVDRYPHFTVVAGSTGTVVDMGDPTIVAVLLDAYTPGAEEWGNEIHWFNGDDWTADLEVIES